MQTRLLSTYRQILSGLQNLCTFSSPDQFLLLAGAFNISGDDYGDTDQVLTIQDWIIVSEK